MRSFYFPLLLTIAGNIVYHVSQKSVPRTASAPITMMMAYVVGAVVCGVLALLYPVEQSFAASVRESARASIAIGIGVASVEIGYLWAYRVGWKISLAPILSSVAVSLLLIPVGLLVFHEKLSTANLLGIAFCIAGLILVRS